jgi:hypothetical protein
LTVPELDPAELGYFEKRPSSGVWYRPGAGKATFEIKAACDYCGNPFMGRRSGQEFCSDECRSLSSRNPEAGYVGRHLRVRRDRGPATDQTCVDCGQPAKEWSQIHGTDGQDSFAHYVPRCRKCHDVYDAESKPQGEQVYNAQLTGAQVRGIRASVDENGRPPSSTELAPIHGVKPGVIKDVRSGRTYKNVK